MKRYVIRSVKYFIALCVLYTAMIWLMSETGSSLRTFGDYWYDILHTSNGHWMIAAVVVLAAFYPLFGYMRRNVEGNMQDARELIIKAMDRSGFALKRQTEDEMVFGARGMKRLWLLYEDQIRVTQSGNWIVLQGLRRQVVRVGIRLESYIFNRTND